MVAFVHILRPDDTRMRQWTKSSLTEIRAGDLLSPGPPGKFWIRYNDFLQNDALENSVVCKMSPIFGQAIMCPSFFSRFTEKGFLCHNEIHSNYSDVMSAMASSITGISILYSAVCSGGDTKTWKLRVTGLGKGKSPVTGDPCKGSVTRKMLP